MRSDAMTNPEAIRAQANNLNEMASSNRRAAIAEDQRGNVLLARDLRARADEYAKRAAEILMKLAETASMLFVFGVAYAWLSVTP